MFPILNEWRDHHAFGLFLFQVLSVVLTQDANIANRYLHPQLLPVRDDGPISRLSKPDKPGSAERADVSSLVVEDRMIPPNRSGIAWSMMSDGSPMFILDAGDEIIIYRLVKLHELDVLIPYHFAYFSVLQK